MSRTAGLGSGDYVAINNTSILSLLLGLASVLSLLYPWMLLVCLAAVVCGALSLAQIRSSNGTQTGRAFAALGILLGLAFGGVSLGKTVIGYVEKRRDERAIDEVVKRLSDMIVAKEYSKAYQTLFSDDFKNQWSEQEFIGRWEAHGPRLGAVKSIGWSGWAEIELVRATNTKRAVANSSIQFENSPEAAVQPILFVSHEGEWMIASIRQIFDKQPPRGAGPPEMPDPTAPQGPVSPFDGFPEGGG